MGRTRRRRRRLKNTNSSRSLVDCTTNIISLKQWMKRFGWKNHSHLKLEHFKTTNRGLLSTKNLSPGERLIEIPYELLVTCATVAKLFPTFILQVKRKFRAQDLLALFLVMERRKCEDSKWKCYLNTLPEDIPPVPWLCEEEEIEMLPLEFRTEVEKRRLIFKSSWERVKAFVSLEEFTWAYVMVNTRGVYVDPTVILGADDCVTSDAPSMALCPYLDMFNHSCTAGTSASLIYENHSWKYVLITSDRYCKYEQIFISYGAHDNITLMCEYGFFIPENPLDSVCFTLEQLLSARDFPITKKQFTFVRSDRWTSNLNVSVLGLSFNLKAVLYVVLNDRHHDWNQVIFSESYTTADLKLMYIFADRLLRDKLKAFECEVKQISEMQCRSVYLENVLSYFKYKIDFVNKLLSVNARKINQSPIYFFVLFVSVVDFVCQRCWLRFSRKMQPHCFINVVQFHQINTLDGKNVVSVNLWILNVRLIFYITKTNI